MTASSGCLQCGHSVRTRRCASTPSITAVMRYEGTPSSIIRVMALGASLVCSVLNTRWPVSAACTAISAVARSRISPTMMMSGSCRISARRPSVKPKSSCGCTCVWLNEGSIISIGSSTVLTLTSSVATRLSVEYSVVVLPEPVGPVTRMMPLGRVTSCSQRCASCCAKPSASRSFTAVSGSKMRITIFSPKAVGKVDRRISISSPRMLRVLMRPSSGRRFSTTSMRPSSLMRATIAFITPMGIW
ncbi:hypothetical protein D9M72_417980 [compost metagenome]